MIPTVIYLVASILYIVSGGRVTFVLAAGAAYLYFRTQGVLSPHNEETEHKHKHNKEGGCGKLCTCKNKGKQQKKKTLSELRAKKGFPEKKEKDFAVDFTTSFKQ